MDEAPYCKGRHQAYTNYGDRYNTFGCFCAMRRISSRTARVTQVSQFISHGFSINKHSMSAAMNLTRRCKTTAATAASRQYHHQDQPPRQFISVSIGNEHHTTRSTASNSDSNSNSIANTNTNSERLIFQAAPTPSRTLTQILTYPRPQSQHHRRHTQQIKLQKSITSSAGTVMGLSRALVWSSMTSFNNASW